MTSNLTPKALLLVLASVPAVVSAQSSDWLSDEGGVLELKVAQVESSQLCGAVLRVDRNKRSLLQQGIPGDIGCKAKVEVSFDDVKAVETGSEAGVTVELKKGKPKKFILMPLPHAQFLLQQAQVKGGGLAQGMETAGVRGPDGDSMKVSGSSAGAPVVKKVELPKTVVDDTKTAANSIREALGIK
jgi:hypothetical protein